MMGHLAAGGCLGLSANTTEPTPLACLVELMLVCVGEITPHKKGRRLQRWENRTTGSCALAWTAQILEIKQGSSWLAVKLETSQGVQGC